MVIIYTYLILMVVFWGKYAEFFNSLSVIFGLLGGGLITLIKWVLKKINGFLLSILGYSKIFKSTKNK